jgi:hypothetical protein
MEEGSLDDDLKITKGDTFPNYLAGHNRKKFTTEDASTMTAGHRCEVTSILINCNDLVDLRVL